jgi:hypothetical protein
MVPEVERGAFRKSRRTLPLTEPGDFLWGEPSSEVAQRAPLGIVETDSNAALEKSPTVKLSDR